jgi:hypothetical protein
MFKDDAAVLLPIALISILLVPLGIFYQGYILTCYWAWYIMPVFAVKQLSVHMAFGLCLTFNFFSLFLKHEDYTTKKKDCSETDFIVIKTLTNWGILSLSLFAGWFWHWLALFN